MTQVTVSVVLAAAVVFAGGCRGVAPIVVTAEPIDVGIRLDGIPILRVTADRGPSGHLFRAVTPSLLPGGYEVCAIAFNHTGGDPTTPLGCAAVVVTDP